VQENARTAAAAAAVPALPARNLRSAHRFRLLVQQFIAD